MWNPAVARQRTGDRVARRGHVGAGHGWQPARLRADRVAAQQSRPLGLRGDGGSVRPPPGSYTLAAAAGDIALALATRPTHSTAHHLPDSPHDIHRGNYPTFMRHLLLRFLRTFGS